MLHRCEVGVYLPYQIKSMTIEQKHFVTDRIDAAIRELNQALRQVNFLPDTGKERAILREAIGGLKDMQKAIEAKNQTFVEDFLK